MIFSVLINDATFFLFVIFLSRRRGFTQRSVSWPHLTARSWPNSWPTVWPTTLARDSSSGPSLETLTWWRNRVRKRNRHKQKTKINTRLVIKMYQNNTLISFHILHTDLLWLVSNATIILLKVLNMFFPWSPFSVFTYTIVQKIGTVCFF